MPKKKGENLLSDPRYMKMDKWQDRVMKHKGNQCLRCGRQSGKSTVVALKARKLAYDYPGTTTLVIAASQRQSSLLYEKIRVMFERDNSDAIAEAKEGVEFDKKTDEKKFDKEHSIFKEDPTTTRLQLKNGSQIICLPTGKTGAFIRGFTVDFLIADEAPLIPDAVWVAVVPMMATSQKERGTGWTILLGTPQGKRGYFYDAFQTPRREFLKVHVPSTRISRISKVFLRKQRAKMTKIQFAQEFLGEFVEEFDQYFPTQLIESCAIIREFVFSKHYSRTKKFYMGVDVARFGGDLNVFYIVELTRDNKVLGVYFETTKEVALTETIGRIKALIDKWNLRRVFIDGAGVGGGVVDVLQERLGKHRIVDIQNAKKSVYAEDEEKHLRLMKEDLYSNLKVLMETGQFRFVRESVIVSALRSITFEYREDGALRVKGRGSHIAEAVVRAAWCIKNKGLSLFLA